MKEQILKEFAEWIALQPIKMDISWKTKIAAYIRVSTNKQLEMSPLSQLKEIYRYAINNEMYLDFQNIFIENEGVSAKESKIEKRIEFNTMIGWAKSEKRPFDTIVVWKFSRFARSMEQSILFKKLLRQQYNINVKSVSEPIIEGPFGELMEHFIEWSDEFYLINLSQEVLRGMSESATLGNYLSSAPFGYRNFRNEKGESSLIIKDDEAEIVKLIFKKYLDGMEMIEIARYVNSLGFRTKRGNKIENRGILYMLLNPVYIGFNRWTPNGRLEREEMYNNTKSTIVKGSWEPIIDEDTFQKVHDKLAKFRSFRKPRQPQDSNPWTWIKGLIRCKRCNHTMIKIGKNGLRCNGYNKGTCDCSDILKAEEVEELVLEQIKEYFNKPFEINVVSNKRKKDNTEKDIIKEQLKFLKEKQRRIKESYMNGIDSLEEYKENKILLENEKLELEKKLNEVNNKPEKKKKVIEEHLKNAYEVLSDKTIDLNKRHKIAHELINKIEYEDNILTLFFNEVE